MFRMTEFAIIPSNIVLDTKLLCENYRRNVLWNMLYKTQFLFLLPKVPSVTSRYVGVYVNDFICFYLNTILYN